MELDEAFGLEDIVKEEFKDSQKVSKQMPIWNFPL